MDIQNDLEYLYKNQDDHESQESDDSDDNIITKRSVGLPKTKRIQKKPNKPSKSKVKLNINFEEDDDDEVEKLKQLQTN